MRKSSKVRSTKKTLTKPARKSYKPTGVTPVKKHMTKAQLRKRSLRYHEYPAPGKITVIPTKPAMTSEDLTLAYSPGVAVPCLEIARDRSNAYKYTRKGNLVGIITNGTAVLGLGNIGPLASKPVMEGKAMLFKIFAGIDVFDIELRTKSQEEFIETVLRLEETFGAVNLEDIKAPSCFLIEERLREKMSIPVMHDDQTGTAVVTCAALLNAMEIQGKKKCEVKVVCIGAGAAGIAILQLCREIFGFANDQIHLIDSQGLVTIDRDKLPTYKMAYAKPPSKHTDLVSVIKDADIAIGVSRAGLITKKMVASMAPKPIIFALANPDPEILPEAVLAVRPEAIIATGRSDYPNQVNNSVCFPYLFRGALDAHAKKFTRAMFHAAVYALANIARKRVPKILQTKQKLSFGPEYILPLQYDKRLYNAVVGAVHKAYDPKDCN